MFAWMAAKWALSAPFRREAGRAVQSIPREVWYALAVAMALFFVRIWFNGQIEAAEKRGSDAAYASVEAKARKIKERADQITSGTSTLLRNLNDEENRRIGAGYDALRLSGAGKAVCSSVAGLPSAAGQYEPSSGRAAPAMDRVPYPEWSQLIAMPFDDLLKRAETCDLNRAEVLTWREWWNQQNANWKRLQAEGSKP